MYECRKLFYKKEKMPVICRTAPFIVFERKARWFQQKLVRKKICLARSLLASPIVPLHLGCTQECQAPTNHLPLCVDQHHIGLGTLPCMWGACAAPRGTGAQPLDSARSGALARLCGCAAQQHSVLGGGTAACSISNMAPMPPARPPPRFPLWCWLQGSGMGVVGHHLHQPHKAKQLPKETQ